MPYMNPELQKLVEYALVDGYITDKERKVLTKKALSQGFDLDELDMILEGKLHTLNSSNRLKVNKCPSCGEILVGLSRVCPSCDYVLHSESTQNVQTLDEMMRSLNSSVVSLKIVPKTGISLIFNSVLKTIITGGLYIIYKKLIKKEALFDRYAYINERLLASINSQAASLRLKYGDDPKINTAINESLAETNTIIKKRQTADAFTAAALFAGFGVLAMFLYHYSTLPPGPPEPEDPQELTERHIKAGHISAAKKSAVLMEDGTLKDEYLSKVITMEIDSLTGAGDYSGALAAAKNIKDEGYLTDERENAIDKIIEKEVNSLIEKNEFNTAKERAEFAGYHKSEYLKTSIKIAESLYNEEQEKNKPRPKSKRKRSRT